MRQRVPEPAGRQAPAVRRWCVLPAALLALLLPAAAASAAGAPDPGGDEKAIVPIPPPNGQAFGFNDLAPLSRGVPASLLAEITKAAGANIHRLTVNWAEVEPERDVWSDAGWSRYEQIGRAFKEQGQRLLITLSPAPIWAREGGLAQLCYLTYTCTYPPAANMLGEWREYVAEVVRRFPGAVIETWNEPNIDHFWRPFPQPERFARLHAATYAAAKAVDPSVTVLAGGLAGTVSTKDRGEMTVRSFMREAYATGLLRDTVEALSIHLYTNNERPMGPTTLFAQALYDMRQARDANGDGAKKIWVTETGLSTSGNWAISPAKQADGLIRRYKRLMTMDDIGGMIIHTALDQTERSPSDRGHGFGVVRNPAPLVVKPAFCEFAGRVSANPPGGCEQIIEKPADDLTGDPELDKAIREAPKALKTKAKSRCKEWNKQLRSFRRAAKPKRSRMVLRCAGKYIAVHTANHAALVDRVLREPKRSCKRQAANRKQLSRGKRRKLARTCTGRESLRALNRLYAEL